MQTKVSVIVPVYNMEAFCCSACKVLQNSPTGTRRSFCWTTDRLMERQRSV